MSDTQTTIISSYGQTQLQSSYLVYQAFRRAHTPVSRREEKLVRIALATSGIIFFMCLLVWSII